MLAAAAAGAAQAGGGGALRRPKGGASQSVCARAVWRPQMRRWSQTPSPYRTPCLFAMGPDGLWCRWKSRPGGRRLRCGARRRWGALRRRGDAQNVGWGSPAGFLHARRVVPVDT